MTAVYFFGYLHTRDLFPTEDARCNISDRPVNTSFRSDINFIDDHLCLLNRFECDRIVTLEPLRFCSFFMSWVMVTRHRMGTLLGQTLVRNHEVTGKYIDTEYMTSSTIISTSIFISNRVTMSSLRPIHRNLFRRHGDEESSVVAMVESI